MPSCSGVWEHVCMHTCELDGELHEARPGLRDGSCLPAAAPWLEREAGIMSRTRIRGFLGSASLCVPCLFLLSLVPLA